MGLKVGVVCYQGRDVVERPEVRPFRAWGFSYDEPRALPWAISVRPFGAEEWVRLMGLKVGGLWG